MSDDGKGSRKYVFTEHTYQKILNSVVYSIRYTMYLVKEHVLRHIGDSNLFTNLILSVLLLLLLLLFLRSNQRRFRM